MDRAQARQIRQQQENRQQAEFAAKLPLIQASAKAGVVSAAASVANATRMENLRAQAAEKSVDYNDRYLNILSIPDVQDKADSLAALQAEVAWMETIPEYKGFVTAVNNARGSAATMALTNAKLDEALEHANAVAAASVERANIAAGASDRRAAAGTDRANIAAGSRERVEGARIAGRVTAESLRGRNAAERQGDSIKHLNDLAADADQAAADASARGDEQAAAVHRQVGSSYRDAVQKQTTFAGQSPLEVPSKSPAGGNAGAPKAQAQPIESNVPAVSVDLTGGKNPDAGGAPAKPKLYVAEEGKPPALAPSVKTPQDILSAVQQMVDDGVMDADEARATLTRLGFRKK